MRMSDWSSDVCSSDRLPPAALTPPLAPPPHIQARSAPLQNPTPPTTHCGASKCQHLNHPRRKSPAASSWKESKQLDSHETKTTAPSRPKPLLLASAGMRSEEHTSELQSQMRLSN